MHIQLTSVPDSIEKCNKPTWRSTGRPNATGLPGDPQGRLRRIGKAAAMAAGPRREFPGWRWIWSALEEARQLHAELSAPGPLEPGRCIAAGWSVFRPRNYAAERGGAFSFRPLAALPTDDWRTP